MKTLHWISTGIVAVITFGIISMSYANYSSLHENVDSEAQVVEADSLKSHSVTLRGEGHGSEIIQDTMVNRLEDETEFVEDTLSSTSITLRGEGHGNEIISENMINTRGDSGDALSSTSVTLRGEGHGNEIKSNEIMNRIGQEYPAPPHKNED